MDPYNLYNASIEVLYDYNTNAKVLLNDYLKETSDIPCGIMLMFLIFVIFGILGGTCYMIVNSSSKSVSIITFLTLLLSIGQLNKDIIHLQLDQQIYNSQIPYLEKRIKRLECTWKIKPYDLSCKKDP